MFDFGFWEIILVLIVALVVVGPERLPGLAREVGLWMGKIRRFVTSVRSDIERELQTDELKRMLQQQESQIQELKKMMHEAESSVRSEVEETGQVLKAVESAAADQPVPAVAHQPAAAIEPASASDDVPAHSPGHDDEQKK
ncbi:MAG: Sec-independent protein translocase protein TatB [Chromatiales bacterium]|jgi:sec-independent protein translocase protein TatB|nr:Sec-independent protein translocase protein TatB [Chromatiales bacterium]